MSNNIDKNIPTKLLNDFQKLGFSDKTARVYYSLLRLGGVGASKIVKETGLHNQFVYNSLKELEEKNMVRFTLKNGRKQFEAQNPSLLVLEAEKQKVIAENLSQNLSNLIDYVDEQNFDVIKGTESFIASEFKALQDAPKGSEFLVIGGIGDQWAETMGNLLTEYEYQRNKKEISVKYVGSLGQEEAIKEKYDPRSNFKSRLLNGRFENEVNMSIFPNEVVFNLFGTPHIRFSIKSQKMVESYRNTFVLKIYIDGIATVIVIYFLWNVIYPFRDHLDAML